MTNKLTTKQETILDLMKGNFAETGAFANDLEGMEATKGLTVASIRATLSSLATKGLLTKTKEVCGDKFLTKYSVKVEELGTAE